MVVFLWAFEPAFGLEGPGVGEGLCICGVEEKSGKSLRSRILFLVEQPYQHVALLDRVEIRTAITGPRVQKHDRVFGDLVTLIVSVGSCLSRHGQRQDRVVTHDFFGQPADILDLAGTVGVIFQDSGALDLVVGVLLNVWSMGEEQNRPLDGWLGAVCSLYAKSISIRIWVFLFLPLCFIVSATGEGDRLTAIMLRLMLNSSFLDRLDDSGSRKTLP